MNGGGITVCTLCDHPFILHPLPPTFSALAVVSAGLCKQVGQHTKELRKEIALLAKFERMRKKPRVEMCHSACVRASVLQTAIGQVEMYPTSRCVAVVCFVCSCCFLHASPLLLLRGRL